MKTLYINNTGPLVQWDGRLLLVSDLNPEVETRWVMSRWEMLKFALRVAAAALGRHP